MVFLLEGEGCLVTCNRLVGEVLEDLLEGRLRDTVLSDAQLSLALLELAEEPADSLQLLGDAQLEELTALLQHLHLGKVVRQEVDDVHAQDLGLQELKQVAQPHCVIFIDVGLCREVVAHAVLPDLVQNQLVELGLYTLLDRILQVDLVF